VVLFGGSIVLWCYCSICWVLVNELFFFVCVVVGRKKILVWMFLVCSLFVVILGLFF